MRRLPLFGECEPELSVPASQGIMIWSGLFLTPEVFACVLKTEHGVWLGQPHPGKSKPGQAALRSGRALPKER